MVAEIKSAYALAGLEERFEEFLRSYYHREILRIVNKEYPEKKSLIVDYGLLEKFDFTLADELIANPDNALFAARKALSHIDLPVDMPAIKLNIRFDNLPSTSRVMVKDIRSDDVGRFIAIEGIIRKATDVRPKLMVGAFECQRCGHIMRISQDDETLMEPFLCESCEKKGPFKTIVKESIFMDTQKLMIQESLDDLKGGENPKQLEIRIDDDLSGKVKPGDRIELSGVLRARTKKIGGSNSRIFEIFLETNNLMAKQIDFEDIQITPEDKEKIIELSKDPRVFELISTSIAPHIYGFDIIKEAVMYQLFSAPTMKLPDGGKVRGDSHIIIMGDPATGKSEILQYVAKELAPRGVYASGKGTSSAGLTAAAVKDEFGDGGWTLEAGALVLADRGIACIDEFDKMEKNDLSAMHEAMEQQTVSIAKAGILATFSSRCSILAAANPKYGRFDEYKPLTEQVAIPPPILSRFDLIFFSRDELGYTKDIARHILDTAESPQDIHPPVSADFMKKYIAYAKQNVHPSISPEARTVIEDFYVNLREAAQKAEDMPIPLTARQLWAIIRLSKARARVRLSNQVTKEDAERSIELIKTSLRQAGMDMDTNQFDIDVLYTGTSKSQRNKIHEIINIIKELEAEFKFAKKSEIIEKAESKGISSQNAEELIKKLKEQGDIFEPRHDSYKSV